MKSWAKYVLIIISYTLVACNVSNQSRSKSSRHALDSLPVTIIEPVITLPDSIVLTDASSRLPLQNDVLFSSIKKNDMSETLINNSENDNLCTIRKINHIDFQELKFAIDDYGNINYLNQDF